MIFTPRHLNQVRMIGPGSLITKSGPESIGLARFLADLHESEGLWVWVKRFAWIWLGSLKKENWSGFEGYKRKEKKAVGFLLKK